MNKMLRCMLSLSLLIGPLFADGPAVAPKSDDATAAAPDKSNQDSELAKLKAKLAEQQAQIEKLSQTLEQQSKVLDSLAGGNRGSNFPSVGSIASTKPMVPSPPANTFPAAATLPVPASKPADQAGSGGSGGNPCEQNHDGAPYFRIGNTCLTPVGFMDATFVARDKNAASSIGSNFGSVPFDTATTAAAQLSEARFSPQNSRIGFRFDGMWKDVRFIGYNEFDFLGTNPSTNITTSNGAFAPRLRLYWVSARKGAWEFLGGQSWSMLVPNRKGISALPGDLFYSQVIDVNYMAGLTWTRQPGFRVLYHGAQDKVTLGFALENPTQYIGNSGGGSTTTLPAALAVLATGNQLDASPNIGSNNPTLATPAVTPDFIVKLAIDPSPKFHFDVAGVERNFAVYNPNPAPALGALTKYTTSGGGLQFGFNAELFKGLRLISTNYWSDGGGRYIFGQAPDLIVHSDGSLSAVHADGTVDGFEYTHGKFMFYGYYGGIYIGRNTAVDAGAASAKIGYGFAGGSQNRAINEVTFGFTQTIWKDAKYGAINLMGQYEYLQRNPWSVAAGAPANAHDNTIYVNLRYSLPGGAPSIK